MKTKQEPDLQQTFAALGFVKVRALVYGPILQEGKMFWELKMRLDVRQNFDSQPYQVLSDLLKLAGSQSLKDQSHLLFDCTR